jgi:hypothetical protein
MSDHWPQPPVSGIEVGQTLAMANVHPPAPAQISALGRPAIALATAGARHFHVAERNKSVAERDSSSGAALARANFRVSKPAFAVPPAPNRRFQISNPRTESRRNTRITADHHESP